MKGFVKLVVLVAVVAGGYLAYKSFFGPPSPACQAYRTFAEHLAFKRYDQAKTLAVGAGQAFVENARVDPARNSPLVSQIAGDVTGVLFDIESEEVSEDESKVDIVAVARIHRYRPGDRAVGGGVTNRWRQTVEMRKEGEAWKVALFSEVREENE